MPPLKHAPPGIGGQLEQRRMNATLLHGLHRSLVLPTDPLWEGIVAVEQHRAPPEEVADYRFDKHTVTLHLDPSHTLSWGIPGGNRQSTAIPVGSLSLVGEGARLGWCRNQATEALVVALDPIFVATLASRSGYGPHVEFLHLVAFDDPAIVHILLAMQEELRKGCPTGRLYGESLATALALQLLRQHAALPIRIDDRTGGLPSARLRRVLDYIEAHLGEDTSLRQLAELARLSPDHFATLFRQSIGLPPHRYVLERRIVRAKELLAGDELPQAEIAYALGYTSQPHFITMFRKLTGITPGGYRKRSRRERPPQDAAAYSGFREDPQRESEIRRWGKRRAENDVVVRSDGFGPVTRKAGGALSVSPRID